MNFKNILLHPKTSLAGLLIGATTVAGVLSQQGITLGHAGTGTVVALAGAIASALLGLLARDPGSEPANGSGSGSASTASGASSTASSAGKVVSMLLVCALVTAVPLVLTGCPNTSTAVHKASVAAAGIGTTLSQMATTNHQLIQQGIETPQEGATMAGLIDQAALANDAFVNTLQSIPTAATQITLAQTLNAFNTLEQQIANLNSEGVLHLKSTRAQEDFATALTSVQAGIAAVEVVTAVTQPQSNKPPTRNPFAPLGLPMLGLAAIVFTPAELDELIALALAAGSALVVKLEQLKGETDAQLQADALSSDASAEQQAKADEAAQLGS